MPREFGSALAHELARLGPEQLAAAGRRRDAIFMQQGITFDATGEEGPVKDRLLKCGVSSRFGPDHFFPTVNNAVRSYKRMFGI